MSARDAPDVEPDAPQEPTPLERPAPRLSPEVPDEHRTPTEAWADLRQQVEGGWKRHKFDAPRDELARFDPARAGLPAMSPEAADKYIDENRDARPWLVMTDQASPEARRVISAQDSGDGHGHIRHDGWVSEESNMRRVAYREDPAQLDPEKKHLSIDGLRPNGNLHRCADTASRITDPDAFATAFARGVEHPRVREALDMPFDPASGPDVVRVPISELLGPQGHEYCTGWRLKPVDGSMETARAARNEWVKSRAEGRVPEVAGPEVEPVPSFEGGMITFLFCNNEAERRYNVLTLHPDPADSVRRGGA